MNPTTTEDKSLTTADFAAAAEQRETAPQQSHEAGELRDRELQDAREAHAMKESGMPPPMGASEEQGERLAPLFLPQIAEKFRARWDDVQISFVDDPTQAVKKADELVAQVMKSLAETFADERANIEGQVDQSDTEHLRVALRRYRSFFQRLLSI